MTHRHRCGHCGQPVDPLSYQYVGGTVRQRFHPPCYAGNRDAILTQASLCNYYGCGQRAATTTGGHPRCARHAVVPGERRQGQA